MGRLNEQEKKALKQARQILALVSSEGWALVLRPWLESRIKTSWIDPRKVKSNEELVYEYTVAWGFAQAAQEILEFVEDAEKRVEQLQKKERGEIKKPFGIGGR